MTNALLFADAPTTAEHRRIIRHYRNKRKKRKKKTEGLFNATIGSFDEEDFCELVGIYIYHENNVPSRLSPQWLCGNSCAWAHIGHIY